MIRRIILIPVVLCISFQMHTQTGIFEIARKGCATDLDFVLKNHPESINSINDSGFTPLIIACYNGNLEVARQLAPKVDNLNYCSRAGTALMAAVFKNDLPISQMLLEYKADVHVADLGGTTALHYAVRLKNEELVRLLMVHGADAHEKDHKGFSPLDYANQDNNKSIIEILKK
jgi:ankyrin repeat protein